MKKQRWRARDYVVIPRSILKEKLSPSALRLWVAIASFCYDSDECWPSNKALLERLPEGTALNTLKTAKRELVEKGLIEKQRRFVDGRETSSLYVLKMPEGTEIVTPTGDESIPPRGNENVTPINKNTLNKNRKNDVFEEMGYSGKPKKVSQETIQQGKKRTVDGFVYDDEEGKWVEES